MCVTVYRIIYFENKNCDVANDYFSPYTFLVFRLTKVAQIIYKFRNVVNFFLNIKAFGSKIYLYYCDYCIIFAKIPPLEVRQDLKKGQDQLSWTQHMSPMGMAEQIPSVLAPLSPTLCWSNEVSHWVKRLVIFCFCFCGDGRACFCFFSS